MSRKNMRAVAASILAASMALSQAVPGFAQTPQAQAGAEAVDWTQAPPLLITEVSTDQASGKRYTYTEVYNNSDEAINLSEYTFYYAYEAGLGTGKVFKPADWGSQGQDLYIQPGKTMVLWQSEGTSGRTVKEFNQFYGTDLVENVDIVRIPYSGIHNSAKRGYFLGKDEDSILVSAWSNAHGDEIATGNPDKQAIQYGYSGAGRECTNLGVADATPGSVSPEQVPPEKVHVVEQVPDIASVQGVGGDGLTVTAQIPYEGTPSAMKVTLHYRQMAGQQETAYTNYKEVDMTATGDGQSFVGQVPAERIYADQVQWYVTASYGPGKSAQTQEQTTNVSPVVPQDTQAAPLVVTEVAANPGSPDGGQYSYFEVYNQTDKPINLGYYKVLYYYDYPTRTAAQSGKTWTVGDFTTTIQPGQTMVYWLTSNGTTVEQFNNFYGTDLELGKDIVQVNYSGLHGSAPRWIRLGTSEEDAFTVAGFNTASDQFSSARTALQYACPHGTSEENASIPATVSQATPGQVEPWQVLGQLLPFQGYPNYPADDGKAPTLNVCESEGLPVPASIQEGDWLKVMYDVDLLVGATADDRLDAFEGDYHCGSEALKNRPYLIGTEILYKLDDDTQWTSIKQTTQWRLGHFLMQIPADVLFGHDSVTFKVRAYTLYGMSETAEETVAIERLNDTGDSVRLNVADDTLLSGVSTVTANDGGDNANTTISVDGTEVDTQMVLEDGAYFMVKTSGMNNYFKNAVTAPYGDDSRDIITILSPWCELPLSRAIHVDNKYFTYNAETQTYDVTLTIWAGNSGTPFEEIYDVVKNENHEDFEVSGLQLVLANGNSYLPVEIGPDNDKTNPSTELDAWHTIGDSSGMVPYLNATFRIPAAEVNAVGAQLDTTALTDGVHQIVATSGDKQTTANVVVDNTAPALDLGVAQGSVLYQPLLLEEGTVASDANGVEHLAVSLDGQPLTLPTTLVPRELSVGEHTLKVVASDLAGNVSTAEVTFTTQEVDPSVSDTNNDGITATTAQLSVSLDQQVADVTFLEGKNFSLEDGSIAVADGDPEGNGTFPYQLFTIQTGATAADDTLAVAWSGSASHADQTHPVTMYIYNYTTQSWDQVAQAGADGTISKSVAAQDHVMDGQAVLLVQCATQGVEPEISAATALEAQSLSEWDGTGRPEQYDFALAWETDTQYYAESFPYHYTNMNQWIVDNAQEWKIRYVLHTGDIVDDVDMVGQWKNADEAMQIFDEAGMPYGVLGGNHDVYAGAEGYGNYWKYFGEDRFADQETYGGSYQNNLGHYDLLTENGQDLIILYMSWDIYTEEIEWMNQVLQQYSDRKAIIALHRYTNVKEADSLLDYTGKLLQDQVVAQNPNVIAVLNGHYHGASIQTDCFDDNGDGIKERTVYQICTDYQSDPEGGSEYIKFLYFDLKNDKIYLNSYSPYRDDFNYYDTPKLDSYGEGTRAVNIDISELDVDFDTSDKTLTTDRLTVDLQTQQVIASYPQSTGDVEHTWQGLQPETQYGWYARVTNDKYGITTTQVQEFVTEAQPEPVTYTIEATAGVGGSISNPGQTQVVEGQSITYTITCEPGYQVAQVLVDGQAVQLEDHRYTFTDVKANHTIQVEFAKIPVEDKVDLSGLQAAVDQVEGQDLSGYDQEDLQELHQLLEQAYQVLGDTSLTQEDQAMVDELAEALLAALGRLPELPTPQPSQEPSEQPSAQPSQTPDGEDVPQTGDQANLLAFAVAALTACGGLALVTAERKKREQR